MTEHVNVREVTVFFSKPQKMKFMKKIVTADATSLDNMEMWSP